MSYTTTSQLEREARSKGDPLIWQAFFRSYVDSDTNVRNKCYAILTENPEGAKQPALEKLVEKGGVWIERDDAKSIVHVHGALLRPRQNSAQEPHSISFTQSRILIPERPARGRTYLTQAYVVDSVAEITHPSGIVLALPTLSQLDATIRALLWARQFGNQSDLVAYVSSLLHTDANHALATGDRYISSARSRIVRAFNTPHKEEIPVGLDGPDLGVLLATDDTREQIETRYKEFFGVKEMQMSFRQSSYNIGAQVSLSRRFCSLEESSIEIRGDGCDGFGINRGYHCEKLVKP